MKYEELKGGVVKRTEKRVLGLFIDGTGLDRATRRINRKVDMSSLVKGVSGGIMPSIARYYTLIPYEDDSRQRSFLDAVSRAGLKVIVKRLPPKGVTRQVSVDVEMGADIIAFALGHSSFSDLSEYKSNEPQENSSFRDAGIPHNGGEPHKFRPLSMFPQGSSQFRSRSQDKDEPSQKRIISLDTHDQASTKVERPVEDSLSPSLTQNKAPTQRIITVICPGRDLSYPIALAGELGADTVTADFGQFTTGDILKSAAKWIDLSDSETIWRGS